jgi:hypothetical protein
MCWNSWIAHGSLDLRQEIQIQSQTAEIENRFHFRANSLWSVIIQLVCKEVAALVFKIIEMWSYWIFVKKWIYSRFGIVRGISSTMIVDLGGILKKFFHYFKMSYDLNYKVNEYDQVIAQLHSHLFYLI